MYDVQAIRRANPIAELVGKSGVELQRLGQRLTGRCPFHSDTQPSLVVYPAQKLSIAFASNVTQTPGDVLGPSEKLADAWT